MKKSMILILVILIAIIPLLYLAFVYNSLPQSVATHFSLNGQPDDYSSKATFVAIISFLALVSVGMYLLLSNLYKIDPKKYAKFSTEVMQKIAFAILLLLTGISVIIIYSAVHNGFTLEKVMLPMLGLFLAYLGNLMPSVKPNYFVGIRTPWALEDENTWRKTHQLAGKLWFGGGIFITIATLVLPAKYALIVMMCTMAIITLIPVIYSYQYYKLHNASK